MFLKDWSLQRPVQRYQLRKINSASPASFTTLPRAAILAPPIHGGVTCTNNNHSPRPVPRAFSPPGLSHCTLYSNNAPNPACTKCPSLVSASAISMLFHHHERDTVSKRPLFIRSPLRKQIKASLNQLIRCRNDDRVLVTT